MAATVSRAGAKSAAFGRRTNESPPNRRAPPDRPGSAPDRPDRVPRWSPAGRRARSARHRAPPAPRARRSATRRRPPARRPARRPALRPAAPRRRGARRRSRRCAEHALAHAYLVVRSPPCRSGDPSGEGSARSCRSTRSSSARNVPGVNVRSRVATRVTSSRLIGRSAELAELEAALADAGAERPSLAFVAGDSGVGKTRLLAELEQRAREAGTLVLAGDSVALGGDSELPYLPLVAALQAARARRRPGADRAAAPDDRAAAAGRRHCRARPAARRRGGPAGADLRGPAVAARRARGGARRCCW